MEVSVSSQKQSVISPPECMSDPEEQEISEEEDDDRNHKHRRRETRSQSLERDSSDQVVFTRPYRKNNIHFENGNSFNQHQKRHPGAANVRFDSNQRIRSNHTFSRDTGPGRGGGGGYGSWAQRDSRFNPVDLSSHMVQVGSMTPGFFGGRGLSGVSTTQNSPWPTFGMLSGVPTGGLDTLHPIGFQGSLRPPLNSQLNLGIQQRCRDFEERGFCLRGDMCLMEHGVNRIVVDDVQSLSQFNLPVSLPGAPLLSAPSKAVPTHFGSSSAFMSAKETNGKNNESGMTVDGLGYGDPYPGATGTDFYDPDQPLWNNSTGETSGGISGRNPNGIDETVATLDADNQDVAENGFGIRNSRSTRKPVWGQICGSNSQGNFKEKGNSALNSSIGLEDEVKEVSISSSRQGKRNLAGETVAKFDSSKAPNDATTNTRKHGQKAMRTLFVNGVPGESNKRDLLLAHFQKFGNVIDIRIPLNSERAFVQFSKREEAEAALKAPDAVMGNRFIKLWWAKWDSIQDNGPNTGNGASLTCHGMISAGGKNKFPITPTSTSNHVSTGPKGPGEAPSSCEQPKVVVSNGPKVPPLQKKSEALEQLKEELRKKQEMLEQKRNEFRKQLAKFEKQATDVKDDEAEEQSVKRLKMGTPADPSAASPPTKPKLESLTEKSKLAENPMSKSNFKLNTETSLQEPKNSKPQTYPFAASMNTPMVNRYKLDNRTTTIKVAAPLPTGLADVDVLKEYFSSFGEVTKVEIEDEGPSGDTSNENLTAHVTFAKRSAAEKAFANAKCWQGHVFRFVWVTTRQTGKEDNPSVSNSDKSSSVHSDPKAVESSPVSNIKESSVETSDDKNVVSGDDASEKQEKEGIEIETSELMEASEATGMEEEQQPLGSNLDE